ncbi:MAG: hypothetical protein ACFFE8_08855 [Candidatus Heimdallarchaeota archaeon]
MTSEEHEIDLYMIYDLMLQGGGLICSHCGGNLDLEDLIQQNIVLGDNEGYLSHVECLIQFLMQAEPIISSGLSYGLISEDQVRDALLSQPWESVLLDIRRTCSKKQLTPSFQKAKQFISKQAHHIEARNVHNLGLLVDYLEKAEQIAYPLDLASLYSDFN